MISKNKLREIVQEEYGNHHPTYVFAKVGPDDAPQFRASVSFCGLTFESPGRFRTVREAETAAVEVALGALLAKPDDKPMQTNVPAVASDHKSKLNEFAMTVNFCFPAYSSFCDGPPHMPQFKTTVKFDGKTFESPGFFNTLREAENAAALAVLDSFSERVSTLGESPICKILLEIKAQKEGSPLPVYNTSHVSCRPVFTSTVKFNGMEFVGKAANNKKQAENNAAMVAWSALKEFKGSAVSTLQVPDNKEKAPVCESNDHTLIQVINHLEEEETRRAGSQGELSHLELIRSL